MFSLKRLFSSFKTALEGLIFVFRTEPNFRLQILLGFVTIFLSYIFELRRSEWIIIVLLISMVLVMEIFNTALEQFTDLLKPRLHHYVKAVKDVMAAAVFMTALGALIVGIIIFWPHMASLINELM
ncbi:MAG TPA: diacylglycerol kinase family protein [Candidatus Magasanikbacteria bacterium]|nr:diacylglycerol kinase family protein [Candidatus Magasanikbacteria bacterium]